MVGVFSTGTFLINFGQFIPAWDSSYYNMLMSQNFKYERYLKSKLTIMAISVVVLFVLGIPYVYFGWKVLAVHFAAMIYNIGVNSHVILYGGTFNRKKIRSVLVHWNSMLLPRHFQPYKDVAQKKSHLLILENTLGNNTED